MIPRPDTVNQISAAPFFGVKMQKLEGGDHFPIANSDDGYGMISEYKKIPQNGNYIVVVRGGKLDFLEVPSGSLSVLNNSLEWTATQDCE